MVQKSDSRDLEKVVVRLPDGMRDKLKAAAEGNNRSMNAEIVARLEDFDALTAECGRLGKQLTFKDSKIEVVQFQLSSANDMARQAENEFRTEVSRLKSELKISQAAYEALHTDDVGNDEISKAILTSVQQAVDDSIRTLKKRGVIKSARPAKR